MLATFPLYTDLPFTAGKTIAWYRFVSNLACNHPLQQLLNLVFFKIVIRFGDRKNLGVSHHSLTTVAAWMSQSCISLFLWEVSKCLKVTQCCIHGEMPNQQFNSSRAWFHSQMLQFKEWIWVSVLMNIHLSIKRQKWTKNCNLYVAEVFDAAVSSPQLRLHVYKVSVLSTILCNLILLKWSYCPTALWIGSQ